MSTVLIVDDDPDIQLFLRLELSAEGFDVLTADNGRITLEVIAAERPDAVLLDIMMPVLDGWGVLEELDTSNGPAVVMVSAFVSSRDSVLDRARSLGADDFIQKPFDPERISRILHELLSLSPDERLARRSASPA